MEVPLVRTLESLPVSSFSLAGIDEGGRIGLRLGGSDNGNVGDVNGGSVKDGGGVKGVTVRISPLAIGVAVEGTPAQGC